MKTLFSNFSGTSITDVVVICELESEDRFKKWSKSEGGTLVIEFEDLSSLSMTQPLGREIVEGNTMTVADALAKLRSDAQSEDFTAISLFDLFCFRCDVNGKGPKITGVTGFYKEGNLENTLGLEISLSTGGLIGIDGSTYGGLTWFLDGHSATFKREYVEPCNLTEESIWKPENT